MEGFCVSQISNGFIPAAARTLARTWLTGTWLPAYGHGLGSWGRKWVALRGLRSTQADCVSSKLWACQQMRRPRCEFQSVALRAVQSFSSNDLYYSAGTHRADAKFAWYCLALRSLQFYAHTVHQIDFFTTGNNLVVCSFLRIDGLIVFQQKDVPCIVEASWWSCDLRFDRLSAICPWSLTSCICTKLYSEHLAYGPESDNSSWGCSAPQSTCGAVMLYGEVVLSCCTEMQTLNQVLSEPMVLQLGSLPTTRLGNNHNRWPQR